MSLSDLHTPPAWRHARVLSGKRPDQPRVRAALPACCGGPPAPPKEGPICPLVLLHTGAPLGDSDLPWRANRCSVAATPPSAVSGPRARPAAASPGRRASGPAGAGARRAAGRAARLLPGGETRGHLGSGASTTRRAAGDQASRSRPGWMVTARDEAIPHTLPFVPSSERAQQIEQCGRGRGVPATLPGRTPATVSRTRWLSGGALRRTVQQSR
jgi:hypothetical protein